jgi:hypothetical protein
MGRERAILLSTNTAKIAEVRNKAVETNFKESMEIGRDWDETWRNRWPQESDVPGFKQTMVDFFKVNEQFTYEHIRFATHSSE